MTFTALPPYPSNTPITSDGALPSAYFIRWVTQLISNANADFNALQPLLQTTSFPQSLVLASSADGTFAKITVSTHTRQYMNKQVTVNGADIRDLPYNTNGFVYYDDPNHVGGDVRYHFTTDPTLAPTNSTNPARVLVGNIATPASAVSPPTNGSQSRPSNYPDNGALP